MALNKVEAYELSRLKKYFLDFNLHFLIYIKNSSNLLKHLFVKKFPNTFIPGFAIEFGSRHKISSHFLLKKFLNIVKYFQAFLIENISNFFVLIYKHIVKSGLNFKFFLDVDLTFL